MSPPVIGGLIALGVFVFDQVAKAAALIRLGDTAEGPAPFAPFLGLTLRFNSGISFSLFSQGAAAGRGALLGLILLAVALLVWWLWNSRSIVAAAGLGAIVGGALGNLSDRIIHGAVVDYLDFHALGRNFFVFNLADAAITIGVALLVIDLAFGSRTEGKKQPAPPTAK